MVKTGQLFISSINSTFLDENEKKIIQDYHLGGVHLGQHNFDNPSQFAELINSIQSIRDDYPLFIITSHSTGHEVLSKKYFTQFPAIQKITASDSPKLIYDVFSMMAQELKACGVNVFDGPYCDLSQSDLEGEKVSYLFGDDPTEVEKYISAAIRGVQTSEIISCPKKFPGVFVPEKDTKNDIEIIKKSRVDLDSKNIVPFIKASKARCPIMKAALVQLDAIDEYFPSLFSEKFYQYLRESTKFSKIILTDNLSVNAVKNIKMDHLPGVTALLVGADMVYLSSLAEVKENIDYISQQLKIKKISKEIIENKLKLVEKIKREYLSAYKPIYIPDIKKNLSSTVGAKVLKQIEALGNRQK